MPITRSAKKALRQNKKRRFWNTNQKKDLKKVISQFKKSLTLKNPDTNNQLASVYKTIDKTAKRGLIKKNKASRLKSRLTKLIHRSAQ